MHQLGGFNSCLFLKSVDPYFQNKLYLLFQPILNVSQTNDLILEGRLNIGASYEGYNLWVLAFTHSSTVFSDCAPDISSANNLEINFGGTASSHSPLQFIVASQEKQTQNPKKILSSLSPVDAV